MSARRAWLLAVVVAGCAHEAPPPPAPAPIAVAAPAPKEDANDGMKVAGTLGTLGDDEIAGPFQRAWDDITHCYDAASATNPYLGGKIALKLRVGKSGDPERVFVAESTFGNYGVERCVLEIARRLHFDKPHNGPAAEFSYPIEFRARRPVTPWDEGRLSPSVARHKHDVTSCESPSGALPPALMLTVYVAPGGKVTSAGLSADAPLDDRFANCLVQKTRSWRLDDPLGKIAKASVGVGK